MAAKRTTHRSSAGKKLYAVRDTSGEFKDIQDYARAHTADLARSSAAEAEAKPAGPRKKVARKQKPTAKKAAKRKVAKARPKAGKKTTKKKAAKKRTAGKKK
jgi:hypothetical protein